MGQNFDDYPGFQQTPGMPILLQHSVCNWLPNLKPKGTSYFNTKKRGELNFSCQQTSFLKHLLPFLKCLKVIQKENRFSDKWDTFYPFSVLKPSISFVVIHKVWRNCLLFHQTSGIKTK